MAVARDRQGSQRQRCLRQMTRAIRQENEVLIRSARRIQSATAARTQLERERQQSRIQRLRSISSHRIAEGQRLGEERRRRLSGQAAQVLSREREQWEHRQHRIRFADPQQILGRGFAWIKTEQGTTLRKMEQVRRGDRLRIRLSDGSVDAQVE